MTVDLIGDIVKHVNSKTYSKHETSTVTTNTTKLATFGEAVLVIVASAAAGAVVVEMTCNGCNQNWN